MSWEASVEFLAMGCCAFRAAVEQIKKPPSFDSLWIVQSCVMSFRLEHVFHEAEGEAGGRGP